MCMRSSAGTTLITLSGGIGNDEVNESSMSYGKRSFVG